MTTQVQNKNYADSIKISYKMATVIKESQNYLWTILHGSVQCGKSVTAALAMAKIIDESGPDDNLYIALGYTVTSAKNNIFECGGYGIAHYFGNRCERCQYQGSADALRIYTSTGIKYLVAFGTSTKTANNAWHGYHVSGFIVDELDRACQESIDEMKQRIVAVQKPHIICTLNPNVPTHPIYKLIDQLQEKNLVYYSEWRLDDNIALSPEKIQEVKDMYPKDSVWYRRYINGEKLNPAGSIYTIYDWTVIKEFNPDDYIDYIVVVDEGESLSASVFTLMALKYNKEKNQREVDVLKEYYYLNKEHNHAQIKMYRDTAKDLVVFIKEAIDLFGKWPTTIYMDESPEFWRNVKLVFSENNMPSSMIKYVIKIPIETRIKNECTLLYHNKLHFYKECSHTIEDFRYAVYDENKLEKGKYERAKDYTDLGHLDCIDCVSYGLQHYADRLYIK